MITFYYYFHKKKGNGLINLKIHCILKFIKTFNYGIYY